MAPHTYVAQAHVIETRRGQLTPDLRRLYEYKIVQNTYGTTHAKFLLRDPYQGNTKSRKSLGATGAFPRHSQFQVGLAVPLKT